MRCLRRWGLSEIAGHRKLWIALWANERHEKASRMTGTAATTTPKNQLLGMTLTSGWKLVEHLAPIKGSSGGTFGAGYRAERGAEMAFVKAIDFVEALKATDPIAEIGKLTQIALFERDVLEYCAMKKLTRVLRFLGHEYLWIGDQGNPLNRVSCLVLEAGASDLRRLIANNGATTCSWNLQVLRDVAQAIAQLHKEQIAHQDIKPSNVISFADGVNTSATNMKIGDLGRVVRKDQTGPFDAFAWPGDHRYSPPERWYGHVPADWCDARDASDAYMLGSLLIYLFTGNSLQALVVSRLPALFRPGTWRGRYDADLIPVLKSVHNQILADELRPALMPEIVDAVIELARALTHPEPEHRGDLRARRQLGRPVGIDRIHQKLAAVAATCMAIERGRRMP